MEKAKLLQELLRQVRISSMFVGTTIMITAMNKANASTRLRMRNSIRAGGCTVLSGLFLLAVALHKLVFDQNFVATVTEGMHFEKERVVILDASGKVLHISGDGPTEVPVLVM
ncbi:MAG: hypothetical protein ACYC6N_07190 [Pirellulaceae bacterium]